jgi:hypothetical protein
VTCPKKVGHFLDILGMSRTFQDIMGCSKTFGDIESCFATYRDVKNQVKNAKLTKHNG